MALQLNAERKDATVHTKRIHKDITKQMNQEYLKLEDVDVEEVKNHLLLKLGKEDITNEKGEVIWNRKTQEMLLRESVPETVNPYLWKSAQNNYLAGVAELVKGVYIVLGIDSSPIGFIRSQNGWIIQDTAGTVEAGKIAIALVEKVLQENIRDNIKAVIYSHTHVDHLGGIAAFVTEDSDIPIIGPAEYEQSLVDDNLYAGIAMSRRLQYQCGLFLPHDEKGWVSIGLSSTLGVRGEKSAKLPNQLIEEDGTITVDGIRLTFVLTPNTETRAHMCTYFDDYKVLFLGDNSVGTLHNTYTMRGAPVRDANYWGKVFYHLYLLFGEAVEAIYQGHGLPHFKSKENPDNLKQFLLDNAVSYKYTHDQALLLANEGYDRNEIGNRLKVREDIERTWYTRGHYGSYSFNARGTYQKYLGFYDGNPVQLLPLPQQELAAKLISYIGSEELVLEKAKQDFEKGEYQWVATITNHLVYYNPNNTDARYLCADAFEQLAYQTENALWRNAYLSAALELRNPGFVKGLNIQAMSNEEVIPYVSVDLILDHLGINFDGNAAGPLALSFVLSVNNEYHRIKVYRGTILHETVQKNEITNLEKLIQITKQELYHLAIKKYAGEQEELKQIAEFVVDTSQYRNFSLIEPIEQLRG